LTYNLYFNDDSGHVSGNDAVSDLLIPPKPPNQDGFREAFRALLDNPEFMAEGGTLAFGLRHVYPVKYDLKPVYLKGSDAVVYQSVYALGFEPILYMIYDDDDFGLHEAIIINKVVNFPNKSPDEYDCDEQESIREVLQAAGGTLVCQDGGKMSYDNYFDHDDYHELVEWATPMTTYNRREGNGEACMIVRIGKAGDRLAYPTAAQIKKAYQQRVYGRE